MRYIAKLKYTCTRITASSYVLHDRKYFTHKQAFKCDGKAVPLQAWSGSEVYTKLRLPEFMTTAQDGGKFVSLTHRPPLPPGNTLGTHFC